MYPRISWKLFGIREVPLGNHRSRSFN